MDENKKHYTCKECKGTSDEAKSCGTEGCSLNGSDMEECSCTDGKHGAEEESESTQA